MAAARIGIAGWVIPSAQRRGFPGKDSHLARYARRFNAVEINSSFYRAHRRVTYQRWAATVPAHFRFAVKIPKLITHEKRLTRPEPELSRFLDQVSALGAKLAVLLVQLPPSLEFDARRSRRFFTRLRQLTQARRLRHAKIVCEPRHATWFSASAAAQFERLAVNRVAADPAHPSDAFEAAGARTVDYFRLHGSPRMYYSSYTRAFLINLAQRITLSRHSKGAIWCIFDNTAEGHAWNNALQMKRIVGGRSGT